MFDRLEDYIFERMAETKLPGLSAAAVQDGEVVWAKGFGFRDLERGLPATPQTLYGIGSVTKSFTALAILQLAEAGRLDVDDPIDRYVPFEVKPQGEPVRIRHLLAHASGIPALGYAEATLQSLTGGGDRWLPISSYSDLLAFMRDAGEWTVAKPGERWFYLNEGYVLLSAVVEERSGKPYTEYVRESILEPLGMERTFFAKEAVERDPDAATPYLLTRDGERKPSTYPYGVISGDGGLISNVNDLTRYISLYLGRGELGRARLLSAESIEEMERSRVAMPYQGGPFGEMGYGYGLHVHPDFLGRRLVGHGGSVRVATAYIGYLPEEGVGVALLANGSGPVMSQLGMYALALLLGEDPEELPFVSWERALQELEGLYETYKGTMKVRVERAGDFLIAEVVDKHSELRAPLVPKRLGKRVRRFYTLSGGYTLPVEFRVGRRGIELLYERYLLRKSGKLP